MKAKPVSLTEQFSLDFEDLEVRSVVSCISGVDQIVEHIVPGKTLRIDYLARLFQSRLWNDRHNDVANLREEAERQFELDGTLCPKILWGGGCTPMKPEHEQLRTLGNG